ncbi:hypothetical protein HN51_050101, partial [Arachis hypogaea]
FVPWDDSVAVNDIVAGLKGFRDDDVKPFSSGLNAAETQIPLIGAEFWDLEIGVHGNGNPLGSLICILQLLG